MVRRLLPLSGAVSVALFVVALPVLGGTDTPGTKDSAAKVTSFYLEHHVRQSVAAVLLAVAAGFLALFAVSVWDGASPWRRVFAVGAVVEVTGLLAAATLHLALSEGVHEGIAPAGVQALNALDNNDFLPFLIGVAVMMVGAAGAMIPLRGAERILGWAALVLAVASLTFTPVAFFAYLGSGVWVVATSILLSRRAGAQARPNRPAAQPVTA
jgi:hypothetical protein